ncbi:MAG: chemotaxis protein CheC [Syntrophomonadaceae bacterium]|nr:chemotaxis protein CheC [Syntrophomonadaceae bacterium]
MNDDYYSLTRLQLDVLKEIGNIGAGNAATALAQMINDKVDMSIPEVGILAFNEVAELVGGADAHVIGIYLTVEGEAPANILFLIAMDRACALVDMLLGKPENTTNAANLTELDLSALQEVGNIIAATYLNALSSFTGLKFVWSVPALAIDMAGAVMDSILALFGVMGDHVLLLKTEFKKNQTGLVGNFFLLPNVGSLEIILSALGVSKNG